MGIRFLFLSVFILFSSTACALRSQPQTKKECEDAGGSWEARGLLAKAQCFLETSDKGKQCSDSSECEGICVAPPNSKPGDSVTGTCAASTQRLGTCLAEVRQGKAGFALCVD